jgi:hypothetical protein
LLGVDVVLEQGGAVHVGVEERLQQRHRLSVQLRLSATPDKGYFMYILCILYVYYIYFFCS